MPTKAVSFSSWRRDGDKLTFIICQPLSVPFLSSSPGFPSASLPSWPQPPRAVAATVDAPERMLGDTNLFLTADHEDEGAVVGEVEIMITRQGNQGRGYGQAALRAFLRYVANEESRVVGEYSGIRKEAMTINDYHVPKLPVHRRH